MSSAKPLDLGLKSAYDELFMDDKGREENRLPKIYDIPLSSDEEAAQHGLQNEKQKNGQGHSHPNTGR